MKKIFQWENNEDARQIITIPVHNMQDVIKLVLDGVYNSIREKSCLVLILDGCTDNSKYEILNYLKVRIEKKETKNISQVYVYFTSRNLYESRCEHFVAMNFPDYDFILSVQADIVLKDYGFDSNLKQIFDQNSDIFLISGRGTHEWELPEETQSLSSLIKKLFDFQSFFANRIEGNPHTNSNNVRETITLTENDFYSNNYFGRCGSKHEAFISDTSKSIYLSETVMRGPLMIRRKSFIELGGFDCLKHRLGNDDHSLALRGWLKFGYRTAYFPIEFESPIDWGATRKQKTFAQNISFITMRILEKIYHFSGCPLNTERNKLNLPSKQIRKLEV